MSKPKVRAFRVELAICVAAPLVVLAAIAFPGYGHVRALNDEIRQRGALLDELPVIDNRLKRAGKVMAPYSVSNGGKDKSGELSLLVSKTASDQGVTVKSVNAEKVVSPESPHTLDYRIPMTGEGSLAAVIRAMDLLERPVFCPRVASVRLRAKSMASQALMYDVEWQFHARFIPSHAPAAEPLVGEMGSHLVKLNNAVASLEQHFKEKGTVLNTKKLEAHSSTARERAVSVVPEAPVSFRLNGIVSDARGPLALTDRGIVGVGDTIDGYRVVAVQSDRVIVEGKQGRRESVSLYGSEDAP